MHTCQRLTYKDAYREAVRAGLKVSPAVLQSATKRRTYEDLEARANRARATADCAAWRVFQNQTAPFYGAYKAAEGSHDPFYDKLAVAWHALDRATDKAWASFEKAQIRTLRAYQDETAAAFFAAMSASQ